MKTQGTEASPFKYSSRGSDRNGSQDTSHMLSSYSHRLGAQRGSQEFGDMRSTGGDQMYEPRAMYGNELKRSSVLQTYSHSSQSSVQMPQVKPAQQAQRPKLVLKRRKSPTSKDRQQHKSGVNVSVNRSIQMKQKNSSRNTSMHKLKTSGRSALNLNSKSGRAAAEKRQGNNKTAMEIETKNDSKFRQRQASSGAGLQASNSVNTFRNYQKGQVRQLKGMLADAVFSLATNQQRINNAPGDKLLSKNVEHKRFLNNVFAFHAETSIMNKPEAGSAERDGKLKKPDMSNYKFTLETRSQSFGRLDTIQNKINAEIYKDNRVITSRAVNMINLVTSSRNPLLFPSQTADAAGQEAGKGDSPNKQRSYSPMRHNKIDPDIELQQKDPLRRDVKHERYARDREIKLKNNLDAQKYLKEVILEDIIYHQDTNQNDRLLALEQEVSNRDEAKLVRQLAKKANKITESDNQLPLFKQKVTALQSQPNQSSVTPTNQEKTTMTAKTIETTTENAKASPTAAYGFNMLARRASALPPGTKLPETGKTTDVQGTYNLASKQAESKVNQSKKSASPHVRSKITLTSQLSSVDEFAVAKANALKEDSRILEKELNSGERSIDIRESSSSLAGRKSSRGKHIKDKNSELYDLMANATGEIKNAGVTKRASTNFATPSHAAQPVQYGGENLITLQPKGAASEGKSSHSAKNSRTDLNTTGRASVSNDKPSASVAPVALTEEQEAVIKLINLPSSDRTVRNIEFLRQFFNKFDFLKEQQKEAEKKAQGKQLTERQKNKKEQAMAKDQKSIEQMARVTKHLFLEKDSLVFDYESQGDLFYMVISGKVLCKVPFNKQLTYMSEEEKQLFQVQFKNDVLQFTEATEINKQLDVSSSRSQLDKSTPKNVQQIQLEEEANNTIDLTKMQHLKNPYADMDYRQLAHYCQNLLRQTQHKIGDKIAKNFAHRQEIRQKEMEARRAARDAESGDTSSLVSDSELRSADRTSSDDEGQPNEAAKNPRLSKEQRNDPYFMATLNVEYTRLKNACQTLLEQHHELRRKYYFCNIMKLVRTYTQNESFGELALITNKRRKAKLETAENTNFAVLSKDDYREAQLKAQSSKLKEKVNFLRSFDLFSLLTQSSLRALSYSMEERDYNRGQYVYQEGVSPIDKIYLIRQGQFQLSKMLVKQAEDLDPSALIQHPVAQASSNIRNCEKRYFNQQNLANGQIDDPEALFSYKKFRNLRSMRTFAASSRSAKAQDVQICILSDSDVFGYQELLERDVQFRSCTVRCLANNSELVSIDKSALSTILRNNPKIIEAMKVKWTKFLVDRVSNKLFVQQLLLAEQEKQRNGRLDYIELVYQTKRKDEKERPPPKSEIPFDELEIPFSKSPIKDNKKRLQSASLRQFYDGIAHDQAINIAQGKAENRPNTAHASQVSSMHYKSRAANKSTNLMRPQRELVKRYTENRTSLDMAESGQHAVSARVPHSAMAHYTSQQQTPVVAGGSVIHHSMNHNSSHQAKGSVSMAIESEFRLNNNHVQGRYVDSKADYTDGKHRQIQSIDPRNVSIADLAAVQHVNSSFALNQSRESMRGAEGPLNLYIQSPKFAHDQRIAHMRVSNENSAVYGKLTPHQDSILQGSVSASNNRFEILKPNVVNMSSLGDSRSNSRVTSSGVTPSIQARVLVTGHRKKLGSHGTRATSGSSKTPVGSQLPVRHSVEVSRYQQGAPKQLRGHGTRSHKTLVTVASTIKPAPQQASQESKSILALMQSQQRGEGDFIQQLDQVTRTSMKGSLTRNNMTDKSLSGAYKRARSGMLQVSHLRGVAATQGIKQANQMNNSEHALVGFTPSINRELVKASELTNLQNRNISMQQFVNQPITESQSVLRATNPDAHQTLNMNTDFYLKSNSARTVDGFSARGPVAPEVIKIRMAEKPSAMATHRAASTKRLDTGQPK